MNIGDKTIITWINIKNNKLCVNDIGIVDYIWWDNFFRVKFNNGNMSFFIDNKLNDGAKYKKYNYRLDKLERILK